MNKIKRISALEKVGITEDTYVVSETAQRLQAIRVGDLIDYVTEQALIKVNVNLKYDRLRLQQPWETPPIKKDR